MKSLLDNPIESEHAAYVGALVSVPEESSPKYEYRLTDIALIVVVTALAASLFTYCLTEYNLRLDCETVAAFRIEGTGFRCQEVGK